MTAIAAAIVGVVVGGVSIGLSIDQYNQAQDAKRKAEVEA